MYKKIIENIERNLLVDLKHRVYIKSKNFFSSSVLNTLIEDCSLNAGSLDQIGQFNFNASAYSGVSLSCGESCLALDSEDLDDSSGMIVIEFFNSLNIEFICSNCSLEYFEIDGLMFNNSFQQCSGEYSSKFKDGALIIINLTGFSLKNDISTLVSTTNFIHQPSFFNLSQALCFTSLPSLIQSSSVNLEFSNILSNFLSNDNLLVLSAKNFLTNTDQFVSGNLSISCFNFSGIDKVKLGIFTPPLNSVYPVEDVQIYKSFGLKNV